ncbi:hypothetical protein GCM10009529_30700 [Micropruina glycogenica]
MITDEQGHQEQHNADHADGEKDDQRSPLASDSSSGGCHHPRDWVAHVITGLTRDLACSEGDPGVRRDDEASRRCGAG